METVCKKKNRSIFFSCLTDKKGIKKALIAIGVSMICFGIVFISDYDTKLEINQDGKAVLKRKEEGNDVNEELQIRIGNIEEKINVEVSGREYSEDELEQFFEKADKSLDTLILGNNQTLDQVYDDLNLVTSVPENPVSVSWQIDNYEVMDAEGKLKEEFLTEDGTLVRLTATIEYREKKQIKELYVKVLKKKLTERQELLNKINDMIEESDKYTKDDEYLILPDEVDGKKIQWKYEVHTEAFSILVIGFGTAVIFLISSSQRRKEEEKRVLNTMKIDYPRIIGKFNLYIHAGMTVRKAWFLIAEEYSEKHRRKEKRKAYEEMVYTMNRIRGGAPEGESYEEYGKRCGIPIYRKFGTMLSQNLRKGSKGLTDILSRESAEAFEERKNMARKLGEEAGTKLMIPMFMMLIVVFAMIIVPAFFSIQI